MSFVITTQSLPRASEASRGAAPAVEARTAPRLSDWCILTKPGISAMTLVTALAGYHLASGGHWSLPTVVAMLVGTALSGAGANALNMWLERDRDALMRRTANRPIPAGRISPRGALLFGLLLSVAGPAVLAGGVGSLPSLIAAFTVATYVLVYTPLKHVTSANTLVGAVPGALPPLIGWSAASGTIDARAWGIFLILFFWQLPHFLAIAWRWREDYERGGYRMLTVGDTEGVRTARQVVIQTLALVAVSLLPAVQGLAGGLYAAGAVLLGLGFLWFGIRFAVSRTEARARRLFVASIVYLPVLLAILVIGRTGF